ncbi:MAG: HEAT repeat domain-containing protein [Chloroflexota bacterium]
MTRHQLHNTFLFVILVVLLSGTVGCKAEPSAVETPGIPPTVAPVISLESDILAIIAEIDPDDPQTYGAPEKIVAMGRPAVPTMLDLLDSPEITARYAAVYVLSRIAEPEDIPDLLIGLEDPDFGNRTTIAATLLWLGDDRSLPILEEAAQSNIMLSFSHPPEALADYALRVLSATTQEIPALPYPIKTGRGFLASLPPRTSLQDVTITLTDCRIDIVINLQFSGEGATEELARMWADAIKDMWDGRRSSKCCVTSVTVNTKVGGEVDPEYGQVQVLKMPQPGARHTSNMTLGGTVGEGGVANNIIGEWDDNDTGAVAAHEVGHGLGVRDEYDNNGPTGEAEGESEGEGVPSIMAQTWNDEEGQAPEAKARHIDANLAFRGLECPDDCDIECAPLETLIEDFLSGRYLASITLFQDVANHGPYINQHEQTVLKVNVNDLFQIAVEGEHPWVNVYGGIQDGGNYFATGMGTVAGYLNTSVEFDVSFIHTLTTTLMTGFYTMGANGELPTGQPAVYQVTGTRILEEPVVESPEHAAVRQFISDLVAAHHALNVDFLFGHLHPTVLDLYGAEACRGYLDQVITPTLAIEVLGITGPESWVFERDGRSIPVEDAFTVDANLSIGDQTNQQDIHFAMADGIMRWFTDCGTPLP